MGKEKKDVNIDAVRELTEEELAFEEKRYNACKRPVRIGYSIYALAVAIWITNGLFAQSTVADIPKEKPLAEKLSYYKTSEKYTDFIAEAQRDAIKRLERGEISLDEYDYVMETLSSDAKFEEFLRSIDDLPDVKNAIQKYDRYNDTMRTLSRKYAGINLTSLGTLIVGTLILAKYRFREMDIEEARATRGGYAQFTMRARDYVYRLLQSDAISFEDYSYIIEVLSNDEQTCRILKGIKASSSVQDKILDKGACAEYKNGEVVINKESMDYVINYFVRTLLERKHGFLDGEIINTSNILGYTEEGSM